MDIQVIVCAVIDGMSRRLKERMGHEYEKRIFK